MLLAMERARELLAEHGLPLPESEEDKQLHGAPVTRLPFISTLRIEVEVAPVRAAFTHVPLWRAVMQDVALMRAHMMGGEGMFPLARHRLSPDAYMAIRSMLPMVETQWHFRRHVQVHWQGVQVQGCCRPMF